MRIGPATWGVLVLAGTIAQGAEAVTPQTGFIDKVFKDDEGEHKYAIFVPKDYTPDKAWPIILFLHGAGERGSDGKKQVQVGLAPAVRKREGTFPFLVVFPQCKAPKNPPTRNWYPDSIDGKRALAMLAETEKAYRTDPDRVYLTGLSMGGFGAWSMAAKDPKRWAALVPVCGGGEEKWGEKLSAMPIWCFHGGSDFVVPAGLSRKMIDAVKKAGGEPRYTEYPGVGHNSWDDAYGTNELYDWLLQHKRKPAE